MSVFSGFWAHYTANLRKKASNFSKQLRRHVSSVQFVKILSFFKLVFLGFKILSLFFSLLFRRFIKFFQANLPTFSCFDFLES